MNIDPKNTIKDESRPKQDLCSGMQDPEPISKPDRTDATMIGEIGGPMYEMSQAPESLLRAVRKGAAADHEKWIRIKFGLPESASEQELRAAEDKALNKKIREVHGLPESASEQELRAAIDKKNEEAPKTIGGFNIANP